MVKKFHIFAALVISLLFSSSALAQEPPRPQHTDPGWQATYWNNTTLSGPPILQITDLNLDFSWGSGSPAARVNSDRFSARWTRYIDVSPGNYRFIVTADDGIRLWIDDQLLIDQWKDQAATTYSIETYLGSGHHLVRVEYYENVGDAVVKVSWTEATQQPQPQPQPQPITRWRGEYFNNKSLSGNPALVRDDGEINFNWGSGSPAPGVVDADGFSVRWSQSLNFPPGNYRFMMAVDDGARLYVNGHLLIDAWKDQAVTTYSGDIYLPGGSITMQMEYYENNGAATARLGWNVVGSEPAPAPVTAVGTVTANLLNIRSGPSTGNSVIGTLTNNEQVQLFGRNSAGTWLKMRTRAGSQGWVYAYYIRTNISIFDLPVVQ